MKLCFKTEKNSDIANKLNKSQVQSRGKCLHKVKFHVMILFYLRKFERMIKSCSQQLFKQYSPILVILYLLIKQNVFSAICSERCRRVL